MRKVAAPGCGFRGAHLHIAGKADRFFGEDCSCFFLTEGLNKAVPVETERFVFPMEEQLNHCGIKVRTGLAERTENASAICIATEDHRLDET